MPNNINDHIPPAAKAKLADLKKKFEEVNSPQLYIWIVRRTDQVMLNEFESIAVVAATESEALNMLPVDVNNKPTSWAHGQPISLKVERFREADAGLTSGMVLLANFVQ